ncbi:ABC transporter substrate-binding protein [Micrococcales bacterium 31B]|nr:ABC transporter substrate-binding protein [Micrococcales bacterium 31B]
MTGSLPRRSFLTLSALAGVATLSACEGGILKRTVYTAEPSSLPDATETIVETLKPAQGQTPGVAAAQLTVATSFTRSGGLDPVMNSDPFAVMLAWHVFEGLFTIDRATGRARDGLGVGEPQQSGNNQYTVTLRDDITFHDGSPLKADDLPFNLSRMKNSGPPEIRALLAPITGMTLRENTVVVRTTGAIPTLKERLSLVPFVPQLSQIANPDLFNSQQAVGTGPWMIDDASDPTRITLRGYPQYSGAFPAAYQKLTILSVPAQADRVATFRDGATLVIDQVGVAAQASLRATSIKHEATPVFSPVLLGFNCANPLVADAAVRRSLHVAAATASLASAPKGDAVAATGFFNVDHPGFAPAAVADASATPAGPITLLASDEEFVANLAQSVIDAWSERGVTATLETVPAATIRQRLADGQYQSVLYSDDPTRYAGDPDTLMRWFYDANAALFGWQEAPERAGLLQALDAADYAAAATQAAAACPVFPLLHRVATVSIETTLVGGVTPIAELGLDLLKSSTLPAPTN